MSRGAPTIATQRALYTALNGVLTDPEGGGIVPVYDEPPETAGFPYITLGSATTTARNTFGNPGRLVMAQLDVWTRSGPDAGQDGWLQAKTIAGEIDFILDGAGLPD